jgi:hypothetical protein
MYRASKNHKRTRTYVQHHERFKTAILFDMIQ